MRGNIVALLISTIVSVVALEGALRTLYEAPPDWFEPQTAHVENSTLGWVLPSNDESFTIDVPVRTNSHGLRDEEIPMEKPPQETRILSLGDSFTFALGVRFEDLYVQKLERILNEKHPPRKFQVINAGVAGYNTRQELIYLMADGLHYEPDLITIGFYWNDLVGNERPLPEISGPISRNVDRQSVVQEKRNWFPAWLRNPLRKSLILYLGVTRSENLLGAFRAPRTDLERVQTAILEGDSVELDQFWRATESRLLEIAALAADEEIPVILISFPMENQIRQEKVSNTYAAKLAEVWKPTGMSMIDLDPLYRDSLRAGRNPYLPYDLHPGPIGMEIAADALYSEIQRQGFLSLPR